MTTKPPTRCENGLHNRASDFVPWGKPHNIIDVATSTRIQAGQAKCIHALSKIGSPAGAMGRVGAAGDNAAMGSFFSLLQNNEPNLSHEFENVGIER